MLIMCQSTIFSPYIATLSSLPAAMFQSPVRRRLNRAHRPPRPRCSRLFARRTLYRHGCIVVSRRRAAGCGLVRCPAVTSYCRVSVPVSPAAAAGSVPTVSRGDVTLSCVGSGVAGCRCWLGADCAVTGRLHAGGLSLVSETP